MSAAYRQGYRIVWLAVSFWPGWFNVTAFGQLPAIHSRQVLMLGSVSDSVQASRYLAHGNAYMQTNYDSARYYFWKSIAISKQNKYPYLLVRGYLRLGYADLRRGDVAQSLPNLREAERLWPAHFPDSTNLEIGALLAVAIRSEGNYAEGLRRCLALLHEYEQPSLPVYHQLGMVYTELGVVYDHLHQNDKALVYHQKRLAFSRKGTNQRDLLLAHLNLGAFYKNINRLNAAEGHLWQGLRIARRYRYRNDEVILLSNLGNLAYERHQFNEAISYHSKTAQLARQLREVELEGWSLFMLAKEYQALHRYPMALAQIGQSLIVYRTRPSAEIQQQVLTTKGKLLKQVGRYREALAVVEQAQVLKDSLTGLDKQKAIADVQATYDLERKQNQIALLRKNLRIQKQAEQTSQLQLTVAQRDKILALVTALLLSLLLAIGYVSFRRQTKVKRLLQQKNNEITQQAKQLAELNSTKDKLFSIISHDLRSPMAHLKQDVYRLHTTGRLSAALSQSVTKLESQVDQILALLTNLLDWSHSQLTGFKSTIQPIDLTDAVDEAISQLSDHISRKHLGVLNQLPPQLVVQADKHQLHSVLLNIISNAVKFTQPGGFIRLRTHGQTGIIELIVQDTGIGIDPDDLARLLIDPAVRVGTVGELSTGLGLRLCRELLARQGGSLRIDSQVGTGTTVRVTLPAGVTDPAGAGIRVLAA